MLQEFPQPPTDNLYKFCALTGTIIFICAIYFPFRWAVDLNLQLHDTSKNLAILTVETEFTGRRVNTLDEIVTNSIKEQKGERVATNSHLALRYSEAEIKSLLVEVDALRKDNAIKLAEIRLETERARALDILIRASSMIGFFVALCGGILAYYGYRNWHKYVQKPNDKQLAKLASGESKEDT